MHFFLPQLLFFSSSSLAQTFSLHCTSSCVTALLGTLDHCSSFHSITLLLPAFPTLLRSPNPHHSLASQISNICASARLICHTLVWPRLAPGLLRASHMAYINCCVLGPVYCINYSAQDSGSILNPSPCGKSGFITVKSTWASGWKKWLTVTRDGWERYCFVSSTLCFTFHVLKIALKPAFHGRESRSVFFLKGGLAGGTGSSRLLASQWDKFTFILAT